VTNEFSNAGTRSWVSAVWTLNLGAPSCTYVTRDVDATGSAAAITGTGGWKHANDKTYMVVGGNTTNNTSLRCVKVSYTASSVTNTLTTLTVGTISGVNTWDYGRYSSCLDRDSSVLCYAYNATTTLRTIDFSGTPTLNNAASGGAASARRGYGRIQGESSPLSLVALDIDMTATSFGLAVGVLGETALQTKELVTGLSSAASCSAAALDASGNYVYAYGEEGTNSPILVVMKNTNV